MPMVRLLGALALAWRLGARPAPEPAQGVAPIPVDSAAARQLVVVVTPAWDSVRGTLRRYERRGPRARWAPVGPPVPVVVGINGLAWGADSLGAARHPRKHEGDGRAPAGIFPLDTAFGFAPGRGPEWLRLPYRALDERTECVDDTASVHYNTIVDRSAVPRVDWGSSEHMRRVEQYRLGAVVGYNVRPIRRGRGSCIFLHIWGGPTTGTAGCTAMPAADLETVLRWLDPRERPALVQLTVREYARLRRRWRLP
jgi:D-alanyl-D-alanine dipeptidase